MIACTLWHYGPTKHYISLRGESLLDKVLLITGDGWWYSPQVLAPSPRSKSTRSDDTNVKLRRLMAMLLVPLSCTKGALREPQLP